MGASDRQVEGFKVRAPVRDRTRRGLVETRGEPDARDFGVEMANDGTDHLAQRSSERKSKLVVDFLLCVRNSLGLQFQTRYRSLFPRHREQSRKWIAFFAIKDLDEAHDLVL